MNYRHLGKQKTFAFGVYPDTGLADAREQRDAAEKAQLDRLAAIVAASNSFKAVADEWLVKVEREGRSGVTIKKLLWLLDSINASLLGKRPIASISAQELLIMLRKMEGKGRYETAKRLRSTCSQIFRYAIATARAERRGGGPSRRADRAPAYPPDPRPLTPTMRAGCCGRSKRSTVSPIPKQRCSCSRTCSCA